MKPISLTATIATRIPAFARITLSGLTTKGSCISTSELINSPDAIAIQTLALLAAAVKSAMAIVSVQASTQRSEVQYALSSPQKLHIEDRKSTRLNSSH